eukprot:2992580-Pleurochrysis_carterae.AAC.4
MPTEEGAELGPLTMLCASEEPSERDECLPLAEWCSSGAPLVRASAWGLAAGASASDCALRFDFEDFRETTIHASSASAASRVGGALTALASACALACTRKSECSPRLTESESDTFTPDELLFKKAEPPSREPPFGSLGDPCVDELLQSVSVSAARGR